MKDQNKEKRDKAQSELVDDLLTSWDNYEGHLLPCSDDLTLLTLKGHLVIESLLEAILARRLRIPQLPDENAKLEFYQKLKLVQSVVCNCEPGPNADLFW